MSLFVRVARRSRRDVAVRIFALNAASSAVTSVVAVITARVLGPAGRGALVLQLTMVALVALVASLGTSTSARYLMVSPDAPRPVTFNEYAGLTYVLAVACGALTAVASVTLLPLAGVEVSGIAAALAALYGAGLLLGMQLADGLHAFGRHVFAVLATLIANLMVLLTVTAFAVAGVDTYVKYLAVYCAGGAMQAGLAAIFLLASGQQLRPVFSARAWRDILRIGVAATGVSLGQSLTFRVDRYIVGVLMTPTAVGIYSVAATVPELLRLIPYAWGQTVFRRAAAEREYDVRSLAKTRRSVLALVGVAGVAAALLVPFAVPLLFGKEFGRAVAPLCVLLVAELAITTFYLDVRYLTGRGRMKDATGASLVGLVVVLCADLILIPLAGLMGAALASVVAYAAMSWMARRAVGRLPDLSGPAQVV